MCFSAAIILERLADTNHARINAAHVLVEIIAHVLVEIIAW